MGSRVLRLTAGPALAAFLLVGAASPALADATNANANAAQAQSKADASNGKPAASNANEKAGSNANAANNPHAAQPQAPAEDNAAPSNTAAPSQTTTSSTSSSTKSSSTKSTATPGPKGAGCNQTPYGSGGSGANTGGVYDDTCEPKASGNGNGGGVAKGKPAAGTVGKADEKNPPGQQPGPNDRNKGYECDGNKGIARTNPAHTGCKTSNECVPTTQNPCEEPECVPTAEDDCVPDCVPTAEDDCEPDCVPTAEDDCEPDCVPTVEDPCEPPCVPTDEDPCTTPVCVESATVTCTEVEGEVIERTPGGGAKVLGAVFTRGGTLARTGGSVLDLSLIGVGLVAAGNVLARASRRRSVRA